MGVDEGGLILDLRWVEDRDIRLVPLPEEVQVNVRKQEKIIDGFNPIVGVLRKKNGYPTSFILAETYLRAGELRECFVKHTLRRCCLAARTSDVSL